MAVDGDLDSLWNSGRILLGWFRVSPDGLYLVNQVELILAQAPPGPTMHELWLGDSSGTRSLYERLISEITEDGQTLAVTIEPPRSIDEVMVRTVSSPSRVAWREVRVFGVPADSAPPPPLTLTEIVSGLILPVQLAHAGDGSGRLFLVEQAGRIRIIRNTALPDAAPAWSVLEILFLDITTRVSCCGERGLLDVAFPPGFDAKQHFFVGCTDLDGHTVISRFKITADPHIADPADERVLLTIEQPHKTHNGGRLPFGPQDGYLYIGTGDGGVPAFDDPDTRGQNFSSLLGQILHIDVESGVAPYAVPPTNPFHER